MGTQGNEEEGPKRLLRFFVCSGNPLGSETAWVGLKFCNMNNLESFPPTMALSPFCFPLNGEINAGKSLSSNEVSADGECFCFSNLNIMSGKIR